MIRGDNGKVDKLNGDNHEQLSQADPVSLPPVSELVGVAQSVLHAAEALLDLVCQRDVKDHRAQESAEDYLLAGRRLHEVFKHTLVCEDLGDEEREWHELTKDQEPVLSSALGSLRCVMVVKVSHSCLTEVLLLIALLDNVFCFLE